MPIRCNLLIAPLSLLKALSLSRSSTLTDLAMIAVVPTPTAHRILATLQMHGFVDLDEVRQEYSVGLEAFRVGSVFLKNKGLTEIGLMAMRKLVEATDETANLAIPDGHQVVFVGQIETGNPIRAFFPPGTRTPMRIGHRQGHSGGIARRGGCATVATGGAAGLHRSYTCNH